MIRYIIRITLELLWMDWQYVGSFDVEKVSYEPINGFSKQDFDVIVHCYESRWGTRHSKIQILSTSPLNIFRTWRVSRFGAYQTEVYPWLRGRVNSKIPTYRKIKGGKWDFKRLLRGDDKSLNSTE